ncbi:MAG: IPT/TIG domain-containing protein, partial [Planctomycetes bacterium]|nr:IPT/TIG domain-containing protein [Planctomycetota bacterium]
MSITLRLSLHLLFLALAFGVVACSDDDKKSSPASVTLASSTAQAGTATTVTAPVGSSLEGAAATLPADALPAGATLSVATAPAQVVLDTAFVRVGPTVSFSARDAQGSALTSFIGGAVADITVPFNQAMLDSEVTNDPTGETLLFRFNADGGEPTVLPANVGAGSVSATTDHFSLFFLMRRRSSVNGVSLSAASPSSASTAGGTMLTITGQGFVGEPSVTIGGNPAGDVNVVNVRTITCLTPPGSAGAADIVVQTAYGSDSLSMGFTYVEPAPMIGVVSINPTSGLLAGEAFTLTGMNFSNGPLTVTFGGNAATNINVVNDTSLTGMAPAASSAGAVDVVVTNPTGSAT